MMAHELLRTDAVDPAHPTDIDVLALEALMARSWPASETEDLDGWLCRASGGWTGRGNSALPLVPDDRMRETADERIRRVQRWYRSRRLPPMIAVVHPTMAWLGDRLQARGWTARHGAQVMVGSLGEILDRLPTPPDPPPVEITEVPDAAWLGAYHYRGESLPDHAVHILRGGDARFVSVRLGNHPVAVLRYVVDGAWIGLTSMEVDPAHRRTGLASAMIRATLEQVAHDGVRHVWLQVDPLNTAGTRLYRRAGLNVHHTYRYHQLGER
jgi:N-acetylglutamate synthase